MWVLIEQSLGGSDDDNRSRSFYLPCGTHKVGRKNCDITFSSDKSISRSHASLTVSPPTQGTTSAPGTQDVSYGNSILKVEDLGSKFKTKVNGQEIQPGSPTVVTPEDEIEFGGAGSKVIARPLGLRFCISRVNRTCKKSGPAACGGCKKCIYELSAKLGGQMVNEWDDECTHLVMAKDLIATTKVIYAVIFGRPVIQPSWLAAMLQRENLDSPLVFEKEHEPPNRAPVIKEFGKPRRSFLKDYVFVSLAKDYEGEYLARAAGAVVVSMYSASSDGGSFHAHQWRAIRQSHHPKSIAALVLPGSVLPKEVTEYLLKMGNRWTDKAQIAQAIISLDLDQLFATNQVEGEQPLHKDDLQPVARSLTSALTTPGFPTTQISQAILAEGSTNLKQEPTYKTPDDDWNASAAPQHQEQSIKVGDTSLGKATNDKIEDVVDSDDKTDHQKTTSARNIQRFKRRRNLDEQEDHSSGNNGECPGDAEGESLDEPKAKRPLLASSARSTLKPSDSPNNPKGGGSPDASSRVPTSEMPNENTNTVKSPTWRSPQPSKGSSRSPAANPGPVGTGAAAAAAAAEEDPLASPSPARRRQARSPAAAAAAAPGHPLAATGGGGGWVTKLSEGDKGARAREGRRVAARAALAAQREAPRSPAAAATAAAAAAPGGEGGDDDDGPPARCQPVVEERSLVVIKHERVPSPTSRRSNLPNFKRFRKNHVLYGNDDLEDLVALTALRPVLPRETERELVLREEAARLDEEQRAAEALFLEHATTSRRGGGGLGSRRGGRSSQATPRPVPGAAGAAASPVTAGSAPLAGSSASSTVTGTGTGTQARAGRGRFRRRA